MDVVVLRYTSLSQNVPIYVMVIQRYLMLLIPTTDTVPDDCKHIGCFDFPPVTFG